MFHQVALQPDSSSIRAKRYPPETLLRMGGQVTALLSQHSSLKMYKRSIERQLAMMAAHIHVDDVPLLPYRVFLLLEIRGSGGVSIPLEQIACILDEVGYWKPPAHVQNYHRQDVYQLGKSAQRLFDDYAALDKRVTQLQAQLAYIKERRHMEPETPPQEVFASLAMATEEATVQAEVDTVIKLLEQTTHSGWFSKWLFVHRGSK